MVFKNSGDVGDARLFRGILERHAIRANEQSGREEVKRVLEREILFLGIAGSPGAFYLDFVDGEYIVKEWRGERINPDSCPTQEIPSLDLAAAYTGVARHRLVRGLEGLDLGERDVSMLQERTWKRWGKIYTIRDLNEFKLY
jgi:hypothetical protein